MGESVIPNYEHVFGSETTAAMGAAQAAMPTTKSAEYLGNAATALAMANRAVTPSEKRFWMKTANRWHEMFRQRRKVEQRRRGVDRSAGRIG
jgi:hypothetical protein